MVSYQKSASQSTRIGQIITDEDDDVRRPGLYEFDTGVAAERSTFWPSGSS